jgi:UDP-N-acetylmuramoylalanine--D-glutamate ligase
MFDFSSRETALVIGLGKSGLASVRVLRARGVRIYATDEKPIADLTDAIAEVEAQGARFIAPHELPSIVTELSEAVLSPGVPLTSPVVRAVTAANVPVLGEIEVAYRLCKAPIVAVTGTKGKSTTTALIGHLLRETGHSVRVGGNIGNPLIEEVLDVGPSDWVVAEVSSFQLETIRSFRPRVAVVLAIVPDHLDRYHSMDEYSEAKFRIFANQLPEDAFVGDLDDPRVGALHARHGEPRIAARPFWFTLGDDSEHAAMYLRGDAITYAPPTGDPRPIQIMERSAIPLAGAHNVQNAMAALLAALAVGARPDALRDAIGSFRPMPHRLEPVDEIDGVLYVDDSKSTNPSSTMAALLAYNRPIILIAGGRAKGTAFDDLGAIIRARTKALIAIGESAQSLVRASDGAHAVFASSMDEAVRRARDLASPGDVVLLSPACASFDMFRSAEDRGERFVDAVNALRETAGA